MTTLTRQIDLDAPAEQVWPLLAGPEGWVLWLADDADVEIRPGGRGRVVDDGVARSVEIDTVEPERRVSFRWWPEDDESDQSHVELVLVPGADADPAERSTVTVTETRGRHVAPTAAVRLWLACSTSGLARV
jgi:uncharacterized protein YndB with AHSA1/START domain